MTKSKAGRLNGSAFAYIRKGHKLSQAEMGKKLGVSRVTVANWESERFALPADIEQRMIGAGVAAPTVQELAAIPICEATHPQCWMPAGYKRGRFFRTLMHPKWWASTDSPLRVPSGYDATATAADVRAFKAPTPQQAYDMLTSSGVSHDDANLFLSKRGFNLFPDRGGQNEEITTFLAQLDADNNYKGN